MAEKKKKKGGRPKSRIGKYSAGKVEKAKLLMAEGHSIRDISRMMGIPESTLKTWKKASYDSDPDELTNLRLECARKYAVEAYEASDKAMKILHKELDRALENEKLVDEAIDAVIALKASEGVDAKDAEKIIKQLNALKLEDAGKMAQVSTAMFEKAQLAAGGATERVQAQVAEIGIADL